MPLKRKRFLEILRHYETEFRNWELVRNEFFLRHSGPVAQVLGFELLSSESYRPVSALNILVVPQVAMLHSHLDVKHREIFSRVHESMFGQVVHAMKEQFQPSIENPLDPREVYALCEARSQNRIGHLCALAGLQAYLGNRSARFTGFHLSKDCC